MSYTEGNAPIGSPGEVLQFTPKQERQGDAIGEPGHNTAVDDAGPMVDVAPIMDKAEGAATTYSQGGLTVFEGGDLTGANLTFGPVEVWDSGLAITDAGGGE